MPLSEILETRSQIVQFLRGIDLVVREREICETSFLPGIAVERGELILDEQRNTWPGDLLHEAGHLAVLPAHLRHTVSGSLHSEVAVAHAGEPEATAWAYAALMAMGLPAEVLFHEGGYHGQADALTLTFSLGVYPGAAGLLAAGMIASPQDAKAGLAPPYPHMLRWLRA
jgi:hypothetical protein